VVSFTPDGPILYAAAATASCDAIAVEIKFTVCSNSIRTFSVDRRRPKNACVTTKHGARDCAATSNDFKGHCVSCHNMQIADNCLASNNLLFYEKNNILYLYSDPGSDIHLRTACFAFYS